MDLVTSEVENILFTSKAKSAKMTTFKILQQDYLDAAQLFHWATKTHYLMFLTGTLERHHRTHVVLSRLSKKYQSPKTRGRSLFATKYKGRLIYICPRKIRSTEFLYKIEHGLGCTECMVRLWRSNMDSKIIEERFFFGCGSIPDFGIKYPNSMLLVEYSTKDNFYQHNNIKKKLTAYEHYLWRINDKFDTRGILLFVIDIPRERLQKFVNDLMPISLPVFFTDYETFKSVPLGQQLSAPIYIFGGDGSVDPLVKKC